MEKSTSLKPVLILGGGPVGLGAALELTRCGVPSILIERNEKTSWHPKTRNFNTRSMEIARGWGRKIYDALRELDLPPQWKSPIRFAATLTGPETGHIDAQGFAGAGPRLSPVSSVLSSQDMLEPVMLAELRRTGMSDLRFGHEMIEFVRGHEDGAQEVEIRVRDKATGTVTNIVGSALIAADGASSDMRNFLQMPLEGRMKLAHFINCYFKADVEQYAKARPGILLFVANAKASGVFQPLDAKGRWLCQIMVPEDQWSTEIFTKERCAQWIRDGVGVESLDVDVQSVGKWQMNAVVCRDLVVGRVLLMGDAAHMFPPTGGLGVNTGLQGMHNAVWKLALHVRGKAGRGLLETYTTERKPVSRWVAEQSAHNSAQTKLIGEVSAGRADPSVSVEELLTATRRYGNHIGLELGAVYESQAIIPDGTAAPTLRDAYTDYEPVGRPGHRAPHVWLQKADDTLSTLDLIDSEFTLLTGSGGGAWKGVIDRLRIKTGLNIQCHGIGPGTTLSDIEGVFLERYGIAPDGAVLVRPDGWIAWRTARWSSQAEAQITQALTQILS